MPSITSWTRLEPRARGTDMRPSLEARVHDPLWLLGRQWQIGEFQGEDAGTPIAARLRGRADRLTAWRPGPDPDQPEQPYDGSLPLEALVERETPAPDARLAAETGQHLLRLLTAAGLTHYRSPLCAAYPIPTPAAETDPDSFRYLTLMTGRAPDGDQAAAALRGPLAAGTLPAALPVDPADRAAFRAAATTWLTWYDTLVTRPGDDQRTWQPARQEYGFAVSARSDGTPVTLEAAEYTDGNLDWYSFSLRPGRSTPDESGEDVVATALAAPVTYPGMPARRWWQFEDSRVDFGGIEAAPEDLGRMLLAEFATVYGNDWYLLPVDLPVGSLTAVHSLVVIDTFGERTLVDRIRDPEWSMFELSHHDAGPGDERRADRLFLPPALGTSLEGEPVEEVLLTRDEQANLAWAIERFVEGVAGGRIDRFTQWQARRAAKAPDHEPSPDDPLAYRLMTEVPDHWIPLLPYELAPGRIELRRGAVRRPTPDGEMPVEPQGRLLLPGQPLSLHEEEVPREGATVTRSWQYARWTDGSSHLWLGRRKRPGRGESSSGLMFDRLVAVDRTTD
ncbi:hypothetical protein [Micromonospora sp. CB01531]|uniref:hypothetical protein n=1 Tax=Micromonospora sp. CB01531 TaxID=1718947 RepID=UPI00093CC92E|nr:hypothetical protein [Micromonospora sp. CB01531]OKI45493.1 hypothetical protein A6A27_38015 [Micromonospora sp. CB01531]